MRNLFNIRRFDLLKAAFLCCITLLPAIQAIADAPAKLPTNWLAWATLADLNSTEELGDQLLDPFGMKLVSFKQVLFQFTGDTLASDRPLIFGAAYSDATESLVGFAVLPIDDLNAFAERQGLSLEEDLWLTRVFGVDLVIAPQDEYIWITQLDAELPTVTSSQLKKLTQQAHNKVTLNLSDEGLSELATWLDENRVELLQSSRGRLPRITQPKNAAQLLRQSIRYSPVTKQLSDEYSHLRISFSLVEESLLLKASLVDQEIQSALDIPVTVEFDNEVSTDIDQLAAGNPIIYQMMGSPDPGIVNLVLTATKCHPESIESREYNEDAFKSYREACTKFTKNIKSVEFASHNPKLKKPIATNQAMIIQLDESVGTEAALKLFFEVSSTWNSLIDTSAARVKLKSEKVEETIEIATANGKEEHRCTLISFDMIEAFGGTRYQEIEDLFESLYGEDCKQSIRLIPIDDNRLLVSLLQKAKTAELVSALKQKTTEEAAVTSESSSGLVATFYPDRYLGWLRRIDDLMFAESVGRRVKQPMAPSKPIEIYMNGSEEGLQAAARVPIETYRTGIAYLLAPKVKVESEEK